MKTNFFIALLVMSPLLFSCTNENEKALVPWEKGAFETRQYRNMFTEVGYTEAEVNNKLNEIFNNLFEGPDKVYFEVGDSMGYVSDIKNRDARTEGMSYGMMAAVQFDRKDIFDRLWRWSVEYMQHKDGPFKGYFAWSCNVDGTRRAQGPASDGELYYITALLFASNLWGNDTGIDYLKEAQYILDCSFSKDTSQVAGNLINMEHKLITFVPEKARYNQTDPSYHVPAFYEVWARWANDGRADFYRECAVKSREYLQKVIDPVTGLNPDMSNYDGSLLETNFRGVTRVNKSFRYDSWRVPMNIALDYSWSCADKEWQQEYGNREQNFFYSKGLETFEDQYSIDGSPVTDTLRAGGLKALRHSIGLVGTTASVSLTCTHPKSREFIHHFWNSKNVPFSDGYFDAYYDGFLQLFAFMHLSGNYKIIFPKGS